MSNGNVMGGERPRNKDDAYYTPDALAVAIARRVREEFGEFSHIVEPSAGSGAFVHAARSVWPDSKIAAIEPYSDEPIVHGADIWRRATWEACAEMFAERGAAWRRALVIGNPPYNLPGDGRGERPTTAEQHVHIALDRMRDGDVLAFLLRLSFLGGGDRIERLHQKHSLAALWPVTPRPSFTGGGTDASEYAVFVWRKGHVGPCDLRPLSWRARR